MCSDRSFLLMTKMGRNHACLEGKNCEHYVVKFCYSYYGFLICFCSCLVLFFVLCVCFLFCFWSKLLYSLDVVPGKNLCLRNNTSTELCNFLDVMSASELLCCMTRCNQIRATVCLIPYFSQTAVIPYIVGHFG